LPYVKHHPPSAFLLFILIAAVRGVYAIHREPNTRDYLFQLSLSWMRYY